jgi:hypothetical protein
LVPSFFRSVGSRHTKAAKRQGYSWEDLESGIAGKQVLMGIITSNQADTSPIHRLWAAVLEKRLDQFEDKLSADQQPTYQEEREIKRLISWLKGRS